MDPAHLPLALESPVLIRVDGRDLAVLFCTPLALDDLAVGHVVSRGLLPTRDSLRAIFISDDRSRVDIARSEGPPLPSGAVPILASACGDGVFPGEYYDLAHPSAPPVRGKGLFSLSFLADRAKDMFAAASMHRKTGGMHCASLAASQDGHPFIVREDVGRHNAVDKVIGRGFIEGIVFGGAAIVSSGRIAADMVAKAIHAGIPLLASRSVPTTAAFELASAFGITLVGRVTSKTPLVYCGTDLILSM